STCGSTASGWCTGSAIPASASRRTRSRTCSRSSARSTPRSPGSSAAPAWGSASRSGSSRCTAGAFGWRASWARGPPSSSRCPYKRTEGAHEWPEGALRRGQRVQPEDREAAAEPDVLPAAGGGGRRGGGRHGAAGAARPHPDGRAAAQAVGARRHPQAAHRSAHGAHSARGRDVVRAERRRPACHGRRRLGVPGQAVQPAGPAGADPQAATRELSGLLRGDNAMRDGTTSGVAVALAVLALAPGADRAGAQGQAEQFTPEYRELRRTYDEKHTPKIEAPDTVKRGQWFEVTVTVGAGSAHPSLAEHFVRYIALYKDSAERVSASGGSPRRTTARRRAARWSRRRSGSPGSHAAGPRGAACVRPPR